uniref:Acyltransferase 3 domain-containing protein n=1 Tax=Heliothis virescens TaxID=7102 RepID=A0A2A4JGW2_HELVI
MFTLVLLFILLNSATAVIYRLNDSVYSLMPPLFHLDNYEECFDDPEGLYCTLELTLVSEEPSPLLTMIQEYSEKQSTHYNHAILNQGICIKKTCKEFYKPNMDLRLILEACLNESLYNTHELKARVSNSFDCSKHEKHPPVDYIDLTIGIICLIILMLNLIGSFCDCYLDRRKMPAVFRFVYHFSIFRSWKKLVAPPSRDDRLLGLKGLHGIRTINIMLVITCHSLVTKVLLTANPQYIEEMLTYSIVHIALNGTLIMQTFFITSSFLLVYMLLIRSEEQKPSWKLLPMLAIRRWLRLTPTYAIIFALTATWFGRIASGPYWERYIFRELVDCRRDWWKHLLYINNYYDGSECMPQTWYLAADIQLYCMGAIIFVLCRSGLSRKIMLSLLFVVGMIIPALHTYYQDLDGIIMITPPMALTFFLNNPVFDNIHKRGHTNITGYIVGMAIGYMLHDWQKTGGDYKKFQKYRYVYWCLIPLLFLCCYSGSIYFSDRPRLPTYVHVLYALLLKPVFCIIMGVIIVGVVSRFEGLCRSILEWRPWTLLSRLSFCAYLVHVAIIRNTIAMQTTTQMTTIPSALLQCAKIQLGSFIFAFFLCILVETPFGNLVQASLFSKSQTGAQDSKEENITKKKVL